MFCYKVEGQFPRYTNRAGKIKRSEPHESDEHLSSTATTGTSGNIGRPRVQDADAVTDAVAIADAVADAVPVADAVADAVGVADAQQHTVADAVSNDVFDVHCKSDPD